MSHYEDLRLSNDDGFRLLQDTMVNMILNQLADAISYDEPDRRITLDRLRNDLMKVIDSLTVVELIQAYADHIDDTQDVPTALEILAYMFIDVLQQVRR